MVTAPVVRFAPSPTGRLHVGNVCAALLNWLFAQRHGGRFVLRLDDTDRERSTEAFAQGIHALFHPLRLALTGREQGPEMAGMLPLIGRAMVLSRLRGDVA